MAVYQNLPDYQVSMFALFREPPWPSIWPSHITPWQFYYEGITISAIYAFVLFVAIVFLPTFDLKNPRIRTSLILFFGALYVSYAILPLGIFGYSWCTGTVESRMPVAFGPEGLEVKARIGLHVGILGVNITMEALPREQFNRTIYYNEHYPWSNPWAQGRTGFGKYSNHLARVYRERQEHGVPTPIQWVAEYFWLDGERIRWGRNYRQGAHYAFIILRTCAVGVAIILAIFLVQAYTVGSWLTFILGALNISAAVTFMAYSSGIWNLNPLVIPFRDGNLTCQWGASLWNCVASGLLCMVGSVLTHGSVRAWFGELYGDNYEETDPHSSSSGEKKGLFGKAFGFRGARGKVDDSMAMASKSDNGWSGPEKPPYEIPALPQFPPAGGMLRPESGISARSSGVSFAPSAAPSPEPQAQFADFSSPQAQSPPAMQRAEPEPAMMASTPTSVSFAMPGQVQSAMGQAVPRPRTSSAATEGMAPQSIMATPATPKPRTTSANVGIGQGEPGQSP